jgi:hypothetical protein
MWILVDYGQDSDPQAATKTPGMIASIIDGLAYLRDALEAVQ